jgi:hypothetical protein
MSVIWTILLACGDKTTLDTAEDSVSVEDTAPATEPSSEDTDTTEPSSEPSSEDTDTGTSGSTDYSQSGTYTTTSSTQTASLSNCDSPMNYTSVVSSSNSDTTAVIAHGFFRSSANMIQWAEHLGTWGINALVVDMCHFADHQKNGLAIAELVGSLGIDSPLFVGFSAGGLASLVAASSANPQGVLALDPVEDMNGTGSTIYGQVNGTVLGLIGEPSECNSQNNSIGLLQGVQATHTLRVVDADHCDFEAPTDDICQNGVLGFGACGNTQAAFSDDQIRSTIRGLGTAGLMWMSGMDNSAASWWTGADYTNLANQGYVSPVQ